MLFFTPVTLSLMLFFAYNTVIYDVSQMDTLIAQCKLSIYFTFNYFVYKIHIMGKQTNTLVQLGGWIFHHSAIKPNFIDPCRDIGLL